MVAMCATMFTACSKDDDKNPLDDNGGNGAKEGMITMIAESDRIKVHIETFNEGDIITIDWGDGTVEEFKSVEEYDDDWDEIHYVLSIDYYVEHEYSNRNPHIVTIKGNISEFWQGEGTWHNNITSLNVSKCPALTILDCAGNNLTSLDVSKNTALTELFCKDNNLTSLDVSKCPALTELGCWSNKLTSLDVSGCTALTELDCSYNNLTSLDISKNTALTELDCSYNNLTSLNVSGCTALTELDCSYNNLTLLDVSKNTALTELDCRHNNLTLLNVSGCTALTELECRNNNLTSSALNQIFRDLPQGKTGDDGYSQSRIFIYDNPGRETCDKSIAKNKGWDVY